MDIVAEPVSYVPTSLLYTLVLSTITLLVIYVYIETSRTVKYGKKMPGPPTVPILGNALIPLGIQPKDILTKLLEYDTYGNVVRVFVGPKLFVFLVDPHDVEIILSSPVHIDKGHEYRYFKPWLGEGLLISTGDKWRTHRKIIAPTFHMNILKSFVPMFYENSRDLAMRMEKEIGKEFDVHEYLSAVTVDILLDTAMGMRKHSHEKTSQTYAKAVMDLCEIIHRRQYNVFLRTDTLFEYTNWAKKQKGLLDIIHGLTNRVIRTKKEAYVEGQDYIKNGEQQLGNKAEQDGAKGKTKYTSMTYVRDDLDEIDDNDVGEKKRLAFLDMMLALAREENKLSDEEIAEEVSTIMFEGHDTTAAGSSFVLCLLGVHQDVQAKVYEEINEIFKGSDRQCTFQDTVEMKYLERVIMETLRLYPPVPAIARQLRQDVKIVTKGYEIPKDTTVIIPMYKIHRLPEYYPNPEKFDPDNFLPERMQSRHYYSFVPFSAGPRSCVGRKYAMLKLKVLLSTVLRKYKILSDAKEKDFGLQVDIILKRSDGFRIRIEPREKQGPVSAF